MRTSKPLSAVRTLAACLLAAMALAGCSKYESYSDTRMPGDLLDSLEVSRRTPVDTFLAKGPVLVVEPARVRTTILLYEPPGVKENEAGDRLGKLLKGTNFDSQIRVVANDRCTIAIVRLRTSKLSNSSVVNELHLGQFASHAAGALSGRVYLAIPSFVPYSADPPANFKSLGGWEFAKLTDTAPTILISTRFSPVEVPLAFLYLFEPLAAGLAMLLLALLLSLVLRKVPQRNVVYGCIAYPLSACSLFFALAASFLNAVPGVAALAFCLAPNFRAASSAVELVFGLPAAAVIGELIFFPPRPGKSKLAMLLRAVRPLCPLWAGFIFGVFIALPFRQERSPMLLPMLLPQALLPMVAVLMSREAAEPDAEIQHDVDEAARFFGVSPPQLLVDRTKKSILRRNAAALGTGQVILGKELKEVLTPPELRFIVAHEVAHFKYFRKAKTWRHANLFGFNLVFGLSLLFGPTLVMIENLGQTAEFAVFGMSGAAILAGAFYFGERSNQSSRELELKVDADALSYTRDLASAVSALEKLNLFKAHPKRNWGSDHPILADRVENLRAYGLG